MSDALPPARWPASRALLSAIGRFQVQPGDEALPERRDALLAVAVPRSLWHSERSRRHLNRLLCQHLGPSGSVDPDWQRSEWRLALLGTDRLARLAPHLAAVVVAGDVRRALSREEVCAWRDWLGQEAYDFAQNSAGLLPIAAPCLQEVRRREVAARAVGFAWLERASQTWPPALRSRFLLKLPVAVGEPMCTQDGPAAARLVHAVLAIVESQWCSSFAIRTR